MPALNELHVDQARAMVIAGIPDVPETQIGSVEDRIISGRDYPYDGSDLPCAKPASAGDIPIRIYHPTREQSHAIDKPPVLVYFHGGGWVLGNLDTHDEICRELCAGAGYIVVSVDYRLAPEHPFPAGLNDAYAALCWVSKHLSELGARQDHRALNIGGDSAGANFAAAVCMMADNQNAAYSPNIAFQLLSYPVTDGRMAMPSYEQNAEGYILSKAMMDWFWAHYCPDESQRHHPLASLLHVEELSGLPPALIMTAEYDPLRDEGEAYAQRLKEAGVKVQVERLDGLIHGFLSQIGYIPATRKGIELAVNALRSVQAPV